jgi:hypothetical protein
MPIAIKIDPVTLLAHFSKLVNALYAYNAFTLHAPLLSD